MTPQERYARAAEIVGEYRDDKITEAEAIARIDAVNAEYLAAQSNPYYEFVQRGDELWRTLKSMEGNDTQVLLMCQVMAAHCLGHAETLKGKQS